MVYRLVSRKERANEYDAIPFTFYIAVCEFARWLLWGVTIPHAFHVIMCVTEQSSGQCRVGP